MSCRPLLIIFLIACLPGLCAGDQLEPKAHLPQFDSGIWPEDVKKTDYYRQPWPAAPVLVWAVTQRTGERTDPSDPANWLLDGRPATNIPDSDTDVYFPPGSFLRIAEQDKGVLRCRHITVSSGVAIPKALAIRPSGNVWIKHKGRVEELGSFTGDKHTFIRNDNTDLRPAETALANKILINKAKDASVEIIGAVKAWDELSILSGTLIVGPDARLYPGNRSTQSVYPDARLVLMSGALFSKRGNQTWAHDLVVAGQLLAGTPERPLTRDATLALSYKRKGGGEGDPHFAGNPADFGMVIRPDGALHIHSADPRTARLIVTWNGLDSDQYGPKNGHPDPVPRLVDLVLQGDLKLDGLHLDRIAAGGVYVTDPAVLGGVVGYGQHNAAAPDGLITRLDKPIEAKLQFDASFVPKPYEKQSQGERAAPPDLYR
jgi:hypothetical protein